jgi:hypothetical protein
LASFGWFCRACERVPFDILAVGPAAKAWAPCVDLKALRVCCKSSPRAAMVVCTAAEHAHIHRVEIGWYCEEAGD